MKYFKKYSAPVILIVLSSMAVLLMIVQWLISRHYYYDTKLILLDVVVSNLLLFSASFFLIVREKYFYYSTGTLKRNKLLRIIRFFLTPVFFTLVEFFILKKIFANNETYLTFLQATFWLRLLFNVEILIALSFSFWMWMYFIEQHEKIERNTDVERLLKEAELTKLRQQLQPHFLFNSLNSINALVGSKPEEARKMIQQLSDFLRGTLKKDDNQLHTLENELHHLNLYLEIEKVRFGHRLQTIINADENILQLRLPALLLQPIVENAIKFGIYDTTEQVIISINCKKENFFLQIEVENPYDSATAKPNRGEGFGLNSVQRRLYLLYARNDLIKIEQSKNIFKTVLQIPQTI